MFLLKKTKSLDPEDEPLEVLTFGMVDVDGVIGGLGELMQDAHFAAALRCRTEDGKPKLLFRYRL